MRFIVKHGKISGLEIADIKSSRSRSTYYCFRLSGSRQSYIFKNAPNALVENYGNSLCDDGQVSVVYRNKRSSDDAIDVMTIRNHISDSILELDTSAISIIMWIIIAFILAYIYINYQDMHQNYATLIFHLMPIAISVPFAIYMLITKRTLSGARTCAENLPPELPNP